MLRSDQQLRRVSNRDAVIYNGGYINKKWFETFINDIMEFLRNSSVQVELESFVRFIDSFDRNEMREREEKGEERKDE